MNCLVKNLTASCLLLVSISSVGCKTTLEEIPITTIRVIDLDHGICSLREVTEIKGLRSKWVADRSIVECDGLIGITPEQFKDLQTYSKQKN